MSEPRHMPTKVDGTMDEFLQQYAKDRRERIATAVLAGLVPERDSFEVPKSKSAAQIAVLWADTLIAELDK